MKARLAALVLFAAILAGAAIALFRAPWFIARVYGVREPVLLIDAGGSYVPLFAAALLVNLYFFTRFLFAGFLLVNGRPTASGTIAWFTPRGAHAQGAFALAGGIAMNLFVPTTDARSWGGPLFVACIALAHVAIGLVARVPQLACTQGWAAPPAQSRPKKRRRWLRTAPQERPLVKPPLPPAPNIGGDPFRAPAPTGIAAKLVKPPAKIDAPRADVDNAPAPKLLG